MIDDHGVAVEEVVARIDDRAVRGGQYRCAGRRRDVHARVRIAGLAVEHAAQAE